MRTRRGTYTAATPSSLFPKSITAKHIIESNRGSNKMKCIRNWDLDILSELLQEIVSRLGLKANIRASTVCKTWFREAVSVRKLQPRPWRFYRQRRTTYVLFDKLRRKKYKKNFPELREHPLICYSRDGWLLATTFTSSALFLLNPFTSEHIDLPKELGHLWAFSAAPTSSSCMVISIKQKRLSGCSS